MKPILTGSRATERLVYHLIDPSFLPKISWTGRGKGTEKKIALCRFTYIVNFITNNILKSNKITEKEFDREFKNVLKRAPSKFGKNDDCSEK